MKNFIELFTDARAVSTPSVAIRTFDPTSSILAVQQSMNPEEAELTPFITWDAIKGLRGLTDAGTEALHTMATDASVPDVSISVDLPTALGILEHAKTDVIAFIHNPQLVWDTDKKVIQGFANLRNEYKARGNMVVSLLGFGDAVPVELQQDTLVLEHPLPTRAELAKIVRETYAYAFNSDPKKYKACKDAATQTVVDAAVDALIGLPSFPAEQSTAMCLDKITGVLDIPTLWDRKKTIVGQRKGLTYRQGGLKLKDLYGVESFKTYGRRLMTGSKPPTVILRMDEIQRQLSGNDTDSSGVKGDLLGEWLTWINDHDIYCTLLLGVPGSSKSHSIDCIAGEFDKPVIDYSISRMQDSLVGNSNKNMSVANNTVDSISDKNVWLVATANKLDGLPPELLSRFADIFFFDAPDADELAGIMRLKLDAYKLDPNQQHPDMTGWTGRDVKNCAVKAARMNSTVAECGEYIIPLMSSQKEAMDALRRNSAERFLSASKPGVYKYTEPTVKHASTVKIVEGRKMR
jgi:hypothetical protein